MQSKLFKAETLELLENEINEWLETMDYRGQPTEAELKRGIKKELLRIDATQQFTIGEVDRSSLSLNGPQNVKYNFCIIIFYYYE